MTRKAEPEGRARTPEHDPRLMAGAGGGGPAGAGEEPAKEPGDDRPAGGLGWPARAAFILLVVLAVAVVYVTNLVMSERAVEDTRSRAELRVALYSGNLMTELKRNAVVPLLLSRDPALIGALNGRDFSQSTQRLIGYRDEIGAAALMLLDADGRIVAATDRVRMGEVHRGAPYFVEAIRSPDTVFTALESDSGAATFAYSRRIADKDGVLGVIVVEVDLRKFETSWAGITDAIMVLDSEGRVLLSTEPSWRGLTEAEALAAMPAPSAIERALAITASWASLPAEAFLAGDGLLRQEARVPFRGWRLVSFTTFASARERVNAVIALEIMGFAMLMALSFYLVSRRATLRSAFFQRESRELRSLNEALSREIAERRRAEENLQVAEQTLEQSSKLAALGEMAAAVSHELNQPLAAMKTYLAGARLLLERRRPEEALSSFQRIDDLISRMGAITRQLKSHARKGGDAAEPVDLREAVSSALAIMEPQIRRHRVAISVSTPREPVMVLADRLRLEQVMINLLRNAIDATGGVDEPRIEILLSKGESALLTVRDNGPGVEDLEALFEPFYTTKPAGDGVGLGLAISSAIVADFNGRLTARNGQGGGAVFEIALPLWQGEGQAEGLNEGARAAE